MNDGLSTRDVASIIGVPESRVRYWAQIGLVGPSYRPADGGRAMYAFTDLVAAKAARELTERGVPARRVREAIHALRAQLPALDRPLLHLRVLSDGERLVVAGDQPFEPLTGQRVMDFALDELSQEVAALEARAVPRAVTSIEHTRRETSGPNAVPTTALGWFDTALHETTAHNHTAAIEAYRRALALDPSLGPAHANLGALLASRGDKVEAVTHLDQALVLDPTSVQARMSRALLHEEEGSVERALSLWAELCADRSSPIARAAITRNAALSDARATRRGS
ncbi:MAG: MerR family transcriptional regulator [Polyangia bacterium]